MSKTNVLTSSLNKPSEPIVLAMDWFSCSGIQNNGSDLRFRGGVNAWFDLKTSRYPFIYSEITGYAVNVFLFFHSITENLSYLERAQLAGDWLIKARDQNCGLVLNRRYYEANHEPYYDACVFTFDQWIIIFGLCNLFEMTGNKRYWAVAQEMASFLIKKTFLNDGSMYPIVNLKATQPSATSDKWSRQSGSFHAKALLGLHRLYELSGKEEYLACAKQLAQYALPNQKEDGRFITQTDEQSTHLHPHLYSIEGLFCFGLVQNDEQIIHTCEKALQWVLDSELKNGTIYSFFKNGAFAPYERVDILAQTLRLGSMMQGRLENRQKIQPQLERLKTKLLSYQIKEGAQKGGFLYGQEQDGMIHYHVNAWVTMFAIQALYFYDGSPTSDPKDHFRFFI